ncbi:hypothetical protein [Flavobacterium silvaticum]|uniref:Outer membrane protein beta-barrel domain-containing protein n=1 Tax=Flavobacterium silvaticum TaxID=1852020 RepID=A0A972G175_9FLAO|nr:hypothetical protein [Flavobacterium silvaticum]NMH28566.1 hypothetical protein [Flavobacterium silvaticum]
MRTSCDRFKLSLLAILFAVSARAQYFQEYIPKEKKKPTYLSFGFSLPLRTHLDHDARINDNRWLPDGIFTKFGAGLNVNRWFTSGLHTGTDYRISEKLVTIPVYLNLRFAPKINEMTRISLQSGYGYAFAVGHGDLMGDYKKLSLGLEDDQSALSVFIEYSEYGFSRDNTGHIRSISLGFGLFIF